MCDDNMLFSHVKIWLACKLSRRAPGGGGGPQPLRERACTQASEDMFLRESSPGILLVFI